MSHFIITIGREHGSGGRYAGELLAEALHIKCYDSELIAETALRSGFAEKFVETHEEHRPGSFLYSLVTGAATVSDEPPFTVRIFQAQTELIRGLAEKESCIIVGRCADYVLRDHPRVLRLFLHAPLQARVERVCTRDELTPEAAEKQIRQKDKERGAYYNFFTSRRWGDAANYDLSVNTEALGLPGTVELVQKYLSMANWL